MSIVELDRTKITVISQVETAITELRETYMGLSISGPEDRKGYLAVSEARKDVKARRVKVEHARRALKEDALAYGRLVDGEAKRITAMLEPIEQHLQEQEDGYEAAREAIKRKEAEAKKAKLQARIDAVQAVGAVVSIAVLEALTDEQFAGELATATKAHEERKAAEEVARVERERIEKETADRNALISLRVTALAEFGEVASLEVLAEASEPRFAGILAAAKEKREREKAELEAEQAKRDKLQSRIDLMVVYEGVSSIQALGEMTDEQFGAELDAAKARYKKRQDDKAEADRLAKEEADRLAEQRRKLDEERRNLDAEKQRIEREEFQRQATLKAEQDARDKLEAERKEQERKDAEAKEEEARREAMKPDIQRLRDYAAALEAVPIPKVQDPAVYQIVLNMTGEVDRMCQRVETWCDEQEAGA